MSGDGLDQLVEGLWRANQERILGRLEDVERAVRAAVAGDPVDVEAAAGQAHVLVGALGTYARPGSELLRQVERALRAGDLAEVASYERELAELGRVLRA